MADQNSNPLSQSWKFKDNGDGTLSLYVSLTSSNIDIGEVDQGDAGSAGQAWYTQQADGANAALGALADAAVITSVVGSVSAKLRGLISLWNSGLVAGEAHI